MRGIHLTVSLCLMATQAHATTTASVILEDSGVRGGLIVVVGCEDTELLIDLGQQKGYLVHALDTRSDRVEEATAALRAKGLCGSVSVARFDGRSLPYVDNLVNLVVMQDTGYEIRDEEIERVSAPGGVALIRDTSSGVEAPPSRNSHPASRISYPASRTAGGWTMLKKPVPPEIDEWTHHMYDASGIGAGRDEAVSQPRSIQWKAGPEYSRSHENMSSVSAVVSAGGRVFSIMDEGPAASIYLPPRWSLSARDAFSGVLLWKIPIREWHARLFPLKSGPLQLPRRLVAIGDRVYVTLGIDAPVSELDAATGQVLRTFSGTEHAEELLYLDGKLLVVVNAESAVTPYRGNTPESRRGFVLDEKTINQDSNRSVVLVDTQSGKTAWKTPPSSIVPLTIAAHGRRAFFLRGDELVSADVTNGEDIWAEQVAPKSVRFGTAAAPTLLVYRDVVCVAMQGTLTTRNASTGEEMWSAPCATGGYKAPASIFIVNDLIWDVDAGGEPYRPGSDLNKINRNYTGYDLRTGEVVKKLPVSSKHGYAIMHHRCHVPRASGKYIVTSFPGIEFFDVETGESTHDSWIRGACLYGFTPANGLIYTPPHPCACYTQGKLTGFWAVAGKRNRSATEGRADRLEKGPAYEEIENRNAEPGIEDIASDSSFPTPRSALRTSPVPHSALRIPYSEDWPTYRADPARSGTTSAAVPAKVSELWKADVGPNLSQCVVADGKLFVATTENHTVHALDADSGKQLWQFTAGGRVDSAPTFYQGTILFGSRDGYVYCLTADKGELVWRLRAGATDQRCVVYDQVESVWPVHGSVLVQDDVLWFCAGRSSFLDGGLLVYRLEPRSGKVLSTTTIDSLGEKGEQPPITHTIFARLDMEGAKNDVLSCDGNNVFMRHWAFDLNGKSVPQDVDHLFAPTGFLDTSWFRRTYWIYGRIYVSGAQGWARTGNIRPTGRIMSIDEDRLYGFGRDFYPPSPGNRHQMYLMGEKELLFAATRNSDAVVAPPDDAGATPKTRRARKSKAADGAKKEALWSTPGDLQVRSMVLAGQGDEKRLFVAGAKGDWVISQDAYEGKLGSVLRVISIDDGKIIAEHNLPGLPIFDGMSAARGRLYISLADGRVVALGAGTTKTKVE